jgi:DNA polymerase-3 subunit gamma/tau
MTDKPTPAPDRGLDLGEPGPGYQVLARKYRPQSFDDLIGQEAMVRTLTNAFKAGRIAHAFMLTGVRGVGKTTTARLLARALNYQKDGESKDQGGPSIMLDPPGVHDTAIAASRHPDVLEMDAASRTGVGDVREILEGVRYAAQSARYKVYIIDEVHMLSTAAFNALLKTLEEPPPHVKFIFATTEIRKVPVTVLSRCQRFDLKRVDPDALLKHLQNVCAKEGQKVDEDGLKLIVRAAEGSVRDALSLLDQAIVQGADGKGTSVDAVRDMLGLADRARTFDLFAAAIAGDGQKALSELDAQHVQGADPAVVMRDLLDHCHDVTRAKVLGEAARFADAADHVARVRALAQSTAMGHLARAWQMLLKAHEETRAAPDALAAAEMALLRLAHAASLPPPEAAARILAEAGSASAPAAASLGGAPGRSGASAGGGSPPRSLETAPPDMDRTPTARLKVVGGDDEGGYDGDSGDGYEPYEASPAFQYAPQPDPNADPIADEDELPLNAGVQPPPKAKRSPRAWAEVIALALENRDLKLKWELERHARPVRVEPGQIVFQPTNEADPGLAQALARKLRDWTGETWFVNADAAAKGGETAAEAKAREAAAARAAAMADPLVAEALSLWPGAEISDIRSVRAREEKDQT